jgi:predicted nucleic acid-binding protein
MVFLDANVLVYYLDETADLHKDTIARLQVLVDDQARLVTSHHVLEEVLFVFRKFYKSQDLNKAALKIGDLPTLTLIEPAASIAFASRYASLASGQGMGVNDALLLQLMLDGGVKQLFTYDEKFIKQASKLGIEAVS